MNMKRIKYFYSSSLNPFYNLAWEQYLFEKKEKGEIYVLLWQNHNTVVIGRYQNAYEEVDLDYAQKNGIKIVRRNSGGGAVFHDIGNLNYTFIIDSDSNDLDFCIKILCNMLVEYGIQYEFTGRNDIFVNGYKISGSAQHIENGLLLHHGTLLVKSNMSMLANVLTRNTKISQSNAKKSVSRKVANLCDLIDAEISIDRITHSFIEQLQEYDCDFSNIVDEEHIDALTKGKFATAEWNFGFAPTFNYKSSRRFQDGTLCVYAYILNGIVSDVKFTGDFFAVKDIQELENLIAGSSLGADLSQTLESINAGDYIKGITAENIKMCFDNLILSL